MNLKQFYLNLYNFKQIFLFSLEDIIHRLFSIYKIKYY